MRNPLKSLNVFKRYGSDLSSNDAFTTGGYSPYSFNLQGLTYEYRNLVYTCLNVRAQEVAQYEPILYPTNPRVSDPEPLDDDPFLQLLDAPNKNQSKFEFIEDIQLNCDVYGKCYVYVTLTTGGVPAGPDVEGYGMYVVEPWRVRRQYVQETGELAYYTISRPNGSQVDVSLDEIIMFKYPKEVGILEANILYLDTERETSIFQNAQMKNGASPGLLISAKGTIALEAFKKLKKQWKDQQQGARNAGKTLFTRLGDFDVKSVGNSIADIDLKTLKDLSKDEVRSAFRVPKPKLGDTDGAGLGRDGAETVNYMFANDVVDTAQVRLDDTFQRYYRQVYKKPMFIDHVSVVPENKAAKLAEYSAGWGKWLSTNTILKETQRKEIEGGDTLLVPFNVTPLNRVLDEPEPQPEIPPIEITSTKTIQRALPAPVVEKKSGQQTYLDGQEKIEVKYASQYEQTLERLCKRQEERVLAEFRGYAKDVSQERYIDEDREMELFLAALLPIVLETARRGGQLTFSFLGGVIDDFVLDGVTRTQLTDVQSRLLKSFNEQTAQKIKTTLDAGLKAGESVEQLTRRIKTVYSDIAEYRAKAIAVSEANRALAQGNLLGFVQMGVTQCRWVAFGDACPTCKSLDGTIVSVGTPFIGKGEVIPGTEGRQNDYLPIEGGDAHTRCRCKLVPVLDVAASTGVKLVKIRDTETIDQLSKALSDNEAFTQKLLEAFGVEDG